MQQAVVPRYKDGSAERLGAENCPIAHALIELALGASPPRMKPSCVSDAITDAGSEVQSLDDLFL
jgi:hypothetical protein